MEEAVFQVELGSLEDEEVETACLCVLSRSLTKTGRRGSAGLITGAFFFLIKNIFYCFLAPAPAPTHTKYDCKFFVEKLGNKHK